MILIRRYCVLIAGMAMTGCGQDVPVEVVTAEHTLPSALHSVVQPSVQDGDGLYGEQILDGRRVDPFANAEARAVVLVFVSTDCPIANRYAPVIGKLYEEYRTKRVDFWLVYADSTETSDKIRQHLEDYNHQIPALRDPGHRLVSFCRATRTPEAVVFAPGRTRQYRGRIDDRFTDFGKSREFASRHDLQEAIDAVLAGREVETALTSAIGCHIPGIDE